MHKHTNQEPFVALDKISSSSNEMSASDQNLGFESALENVCNEAMKPLQVNGSVKDEEFLDMLKNINFEEVLSRNFCPMKSEVFNNDTLDQELESWLEGFQHSPHTGSENKVSLHFPEQENGVLNLSPSRALIPSVRSAFSEVSPSKTCLKKTQRVFNSLDLGGKEDQSDISPSKLLLPNVFPNDNFLSPTSSGFSEDNSINEENCVNVRRPAFYNSYIPISSLATTSDPKSKIKFDESDCIFVKRRETKNSNSKSPLLINKLSHLSKINLKNSLSEYPNKENGVHLVDPNEFQNLIINRHSTLNVDESVETKSSSFPLSTHTAPKSTDETQLYSAVINSNNCVSSEECKLNSDDQIVETLNMLKLLEDCSSSGKESIIGSSSSNNNKADNVVLSKLNLQSVAHSTIKSEVFASDFQDLYSHSNNSKLLSSQENSFTYSKNSIRPNKIIKEESSNEYFHSMVVSDAVCNGKESKVCSDPIESFTSKPTSFESSVEKSKSVFKKELILDDEEYFYGKERNTREILSSETGNFNVRKNLCKQLQKDIKEEGVSNNLSHLLSAVIPVGNPCQNKFDASEQSYSNCDTGASLITSSVCDIKLEVDQPSKSGTNSSLSLKEGLGSTLDASEITEEEAYKGIFNQTNNNNNVGSNELPHILNFHNVFSNLQKPEDVASSTHPNNSVSHQCKNGFNKSGNRLPDEVSICVIDEALLEMENKRDSFSSLIINEFNDLNSQGDDQNQSTSIKNEITSQKNQSSSFTDLSLSHTLSPMKVKCEPSSYLKEQDKAAKDAVPQVDFIPAPGWDTQTNQSLCMNKTRFKGGLEVDPWSVPEVYIDELNIEVIVKNHTVESSGNETSTACSSSPNSEIVQVACVSNGKRKEVTETQSELKDFSDSQLNLRQCFSPEERISPVAAAPELEKETTSKIQNFDTNSNSEDFIPDHTMKILSPKKIDIYKPFTLRPEVLETGSYQDNTISAFDTTRTSKLRLSVGYSSNNSQNGENVNPETTEKAVPFELNRSSSYFDSVLSNFDFDENFCMVANDKESESSIENFVSELFFDEAKSDFKTSQFEDREIPEVKDHHPSSDEDEQTKRNSCNLNGEELNFEDSNREEVQSLKDEEESDNDIPIVTINSDDELDIFIPLKKKVKEEQEEKEGKKSDNPVFEIKEETQKYKFHSLYDEYLENRKRLLSADLSKHSKKLRTLSNSSSTLSDLPCCGIYDKSFPHTHSCFISNEVSNTSSTKAGLDIINIEDHISTKQPSIYNVCTNLFTMFNWHANFGNLKMEPEFFDDFSDLRNDDSNLNSLFSENNVKKQETLSNVVIQTRTLDLEEDVFLNDNRKKNKRKREPKFEKLHKIKKTLKTQSYLDRTIKCCEFEKKVNSEYSIKWTKTFSNAKLPPKETSEFYRGKKSANSKTTNNGSRSVPSLLGPNPSVPEVLKLLRDSGWAVTPCNPVINYNVPQHAKSPTIVPAPLQNQYGSTGSDVVLWSLTDKEVTVSSKREYQEHSFSKPSTYDHTDKVSRTIKEKPLNRSTTFDKINRSTTFDKINRSTTFDKINRSTTFDKINRSTTFDKINRSTTFDKINRSTTFDKINRSTTFDKINRSKSYHFFPGSNFKNCHISKSRYKNAQKIKETQRELKNDTLLNTILKGKDGIEKSNSLSFKTLRTSDGSLYVRPSFLKQEKRNQSHVVREETNENDRNSSDDCIELPDDFLAYEEIAKEGYNVGAPPTIPKCLFIPPPSPQKPKPKPKPKPAFKRQIKENVKPPISSPTTTTTTTTTTTPPAMKIEDTSQTKAEEKLTDIVSQRPANEVPDVVCMTIEGKLYVYHRKDS